MVAKKLLVGDKITARVKWICHLGNICKRSTFDIPDLTSSTLDSSAATVFSTPLNPFNVTPGLKQAAILQKPETEGSTAPPSLNPYFLTPPSTVETPSQAPKRKRRRIQFVNYLDDDDDAHGKQKRRAKHTKFRAQPYKKKYKYSKSKKMIEFFYPFQIYIYVFLFAIIFQ